MYWPVQDDSIIDASGNKIEQTASSVSRERTKERNPPSTPLDLSGPVSDSLKPREGETPLDLSVKSNKRPIELTESSREMYLHQMFSLGKMPTTNTTQNQMQLKFQQTPPVIPTPNGYVEQRQMERHVPYHRQYMEQKKLLECNQQMLEQRHAMEQRQALEQRQILEHRQVLGHRQILEQRQAMEERQRQVMEERQRRILEERKRQAMEERHHPQGYSDIPYKNKQLPTGYQEIQDMLHGNSGQPDSSMMKHSLGSPWQNQQVLQSKSLPHDHYRRTSHIRYSNRIKTNPSSDEQYYAMLQTIQKQNAAKKHQMEQERLLTERAVRMQETMPPTQPKIISKTSTMSNPSAYLEKPAQAYSQKLSTSNDVNYTQHMWKGGYSDTAQQHLIAESAQPHLSVENPKASIVKQRGMMPAFNMKQEHMSPVSASGVYKHPFGSDVPAHLEQRPQYHSPSPHIVHSSTPHKGELMASSRPRPVKHTRVSGTPLPKETHSTTMSQQSERSIMKGTSGAYCINGVQDPSTLRDTKKQFSSPENINKHSSECYKSCDGHDVLISSQKTSVLDVYSKQLQIQKQTLAEQEKRKKKEQDDSLNDNRLVTQLFRGLIKQGESPLPSARKFDDGVKVPREVTKTSSPVSQPEAVVERLSSPLSISIPNASTRCKPEEKPESKPRPFSKKQLIMNAVNRDEDLRKIVSNMEKPKTVIFSNPDLKRSQTTSPVGPESPKMPTLSPQQKLQPSLSHQGTEPPTLHIDGSDKQDAILRTGPSISYYQDKRPRLLSSLPRKPQPVVEDEEEDEIQNEVSIQDNSVFAKRPFLHYKKIPIANVAPMIHENSLEGQKETAPCSSDQSIGQKRKLDETFDKHITSSIKTYLNESNDTPLILSAENKSLLGKIKYEDEEPLVKSRRLSDSDCLIKSTASCDRNYKPLKVERRHKSLIQESSSSRRIKHDVVTIADRIPILNRIGPPSKTQKKADDIRRRARERHQHRHRHKRIQENQSLYIKSRRHSRDKARGFIDFKPEVLVNRTRTRTYKNEILSDSDDKTEEEEDIKVVKRRVYKKSRQRKNAKDALQKATERSKETKGSSDGSISLKIASVPLTDCISKNVLETKSENTNIKDETSQTVEVNEKNGTSAQPEENVDVTLPIRPRQKRRFRRRSSTKRIGKCRRRRTKFRKKQIIAKKNFIPLTFHGDVEDDVFANNDDFVPFDSCDLPQSSGTSSQTAQEIKKLVVCKDTGETMLHRAARLGHLDVVVYCLQSGDVDVNTKDNAGYTPLHECCVSGNREIARLLLSRGANVNCASQDGIRPIHDAVENDNVEMVRLLIVYGADPTLATYGGLSPEKIAHSDKMRSLITGYLGDLNGFPEGVVSTRWEFGLYRSGCLPETEVFADIPDDPPIESKEQYIAESGNPLFPVFKIQNGDSDRVESLVLVRDVCEFYRLKPSEVLKNHENLRIREIMKSDIMQNTENSLLFQKLSMLTVTELPAIREESVKDLMQICLKLSNAVESDGKEMSLKNTQKESQGPTLDNKSNYRQSPSKQKHSPTKSYKHSMKDNFKDKLSDQKYSLKNCEQKVASKNLVWKKSFSEESTSNKPSTSGLSRDKVRPADGGGKPPRGVFDLTSDDDSTDIEFPAWEPSSDLNVVKYRHDNIELVSKSSASKMKRKM